MASPAQIKQLKKVYVTYSNKEHLAKWAESIDVKAVSPIVAKLLLVGTLPPEEWRKTIDWARSELKRLGYVPLEENKAL